MKKLNAGHLRNMERKERERKMEGKEHQEMSKNLKEILIRLAVRFTPYQSLMGLRAV